MDHRELRVTLERRGLTPGDFGRMLGVDRSAVSRWLTGKRRVPPPVIAYLDLYERFQKTTGDWEGRDDVG